MAALPSHDEQEALLAALGGIIAAHGAEPLLRGPVEPTPHFFPDAWRPDLHGARAVLRRVMTYARLADLVCELESGDGDHRLPAGMTVGGRIHTAGAAAWFWGIHDATAWFGVGRRVLTDPERVVAALCHESAHAFRRHHGLEGDPATEELLTDVTTVFLGFGILTTNASSRMRTKGELLGTTVRHEWSHTSLGYLPPESMAFLLAAQAVVRRATWSERRRLGALLEPNQAASFAAACKRLQRDEPNLLRRLGIATDRRPLPPPVPAEPALELPDVPRREVRATSPAAAGTCNRGKPVFRVPRASVVHSRRAVGAILGGCVGGAATAAWGGGAWPPVLLAVAGAMAGNVVAKLRREYECSEPTCDATLAPDATVCSRCGGTVSGEIRDANERLAALEQLASSPAEGAAELGRPRRKARTIGVATLASFCLLVLIGRYAGLRPSRLFKPGPTVEVGCENGGWLATRCAPGDRIGFRVASVRKPLYLAAHLAKQGSPGRFWLFPEDDGSVPDLGQSSKPTYVLYVRIPELPPGDYKVVAMLFSHLPTRAEVDEGGASAIDHEEVTLTVRNDVAVGEKVNTSGNAHIAKPGRGSASTQASSQGHVTSRP